MKVTAIILTYNEAKHLGRCIRSLGGVVDEVVVVDSQSDDDTVRIATACGARVLQNPWVNHSTQFNWALDRLGTDTTWVLRVDADEYLSPELRAEIAAQLRNVPPDVDGFYCVRRIVFQGRVLRFGGLYPILVLRLFRYGRGRCEQRWMDEHIKVAGKVVRLCGELIDENLNSLSWWTSKHNAYASREAADLLNLEFKFMGRDSIADLYSGVGPGLKRWVKERVYAHMPLGARAASYFVYRYLLRLGFLDGSPGMTFHLLQGLWYRYLVDAKIAEVKRYVDSTGCAPGEAVERVLGVPVTATRNTCAS